MKYKIVIDGMLFAKANKIGPRQLIDLATEAGADGLHWPWSLREFDGPRTRSFADEIRCRGLDVYGVWMTSHCAAYPMQRATFKREIDECIQLAEIFGADLIECWPVTKSYMGVKVPRVLGREVFKSNLLEVRERLETQNMELAIEFHPAAVLQNYLQSLDFLSDMADCFSITFDTFHSNNVGDEPASILAGRTERINVIHLSASNRLSINNPSDLFDYRQIIHNAIINGFEGLFVIQYKATPREFSSIKRSVSYVREIVSNTLLLVDGDKGEYSSGPT